MAQLVLLWDDGDWFAKGTLVKWVTNGGNRCKRRKKIKDEYLGNILGRKYYNAMLEENGCKIGSRSLANA